MIPRVVHLVFGLRQQDEPFHLLHHLAVASCQAVLQPDQIVLHLHHLPYGVYWDLTRPLVEVERIEPVDEVESVPAAPEVQRYRYAHHADVVRLDVLLRHGGLYADIDTLFHQPLPDDLWDRPAVIGAEAPVQYADAAEPEPSVSNALVLAEPGSTFLRAWREQIFDAMDGSWSSHACRLPTRLAAAMPEHVHVEPQASFSPFDHTPAGVAELLDEPMLPGRLDATFSAHLCAHLWWSEDRRDFSPTSALDLTEAHLRATDAPIGHLARPHLPSHGLF